MNETRFMAVTKQEAELLMDSFRVSNPLTRDIALKAASLVLEFASQPCVGEANDLVGSTNIVCAIDADCA